ncbi:hypothetical protein IJT17_07960, partial [bacterium]|nr:hypothetical protein [bacterium]
LILADSVDGAEIDETAIAAEADMLAARKEALLENGDTEAEEAEEAEALDPEVEADVEELLNEAEAEEAYAAEAEMTEAEEDEYVLQTNEDPAGMVIADDEAENVEFPEDRIRSLKGNALEVSQVPHILEVRPVSECDDAVAIFGEGFYPNSAVIIGEQGYETSHNLGHCLIVNGIPAEELEQVFSGESEVRVVSRIFEDDTIKELSSVGYSEEAISDEPVSLADMGLLAKDEGETAVSGSASKSVGEPSVDGGYCFIATAAYGSYLEPEVKVLRAFRDAHLLTNAPGRAFVKFYYANSPVVANYIAARPWARCATRLALTPVVVSVSHPVLGLLAVVLLIGGGIAYRRRRDDAAA